MAGPVFDTQTVVCGGVDLGATSLANAGLNITFQEHATENRSGYVAFKRGGSETWRIRAGSTGLDNNLPPAGLRFMSNITTDVVVFGASGDIYCKDAIYPSGGTTYYLAANPNGLHTLGRLGIGTPTPGTLLYVKGAAASGAPAWDPTDYVVVEGGVFANIAILTNWENGQGSLMFSDKDSRYAGLIQYQHATDVMRFFTRSNEVMTLDAQGNLRLVGALAKIHGQPNVGIASNQFDDLIFNYNGAVYWFRGTQGGGAQSGPQFMKLDTDGSLWLGRPTPRKAIDNAGACLYF